MPRTANTAPADETKSDKFKRLAIARVNKTLAAINQIGQLSTKANYEYTPEQVVKILDTLGEALNKIEASFEGKKPAEEGFTL